MPNRNYFDTLEKCLFVAEIGVNHNGDVEFAKKLVLAAKAAGADAVKFQSFTADRLVTRGTPKVAYQTETTNPDESHFDMIRKLELGTSEHLELFKFCNAAGIKFISTPYDIESAVFLNSIGVSMFKTASADLVDLPLQRYIASTGKPTMVATGMSTLGEVERVVNIYHEANNPHLVLLHCVSNYPCSDNSINLRATLTMGQAFGTPIGYSDHSVGHLAAALSLAMGAKVIEKHFTIDKSLPGPDHKASSTPDEFAELVAQGRRAELILGSRRKSMQPEEVQMSKVSRKSLVVSEDLARGTVLTSAHLRLMRPGTGIEACFMESLIGRRVVRDLGAFEQLQWADLEVIT